MNSSSLTFSETLHQRVIELLDEALVVEDAEFKIILVNKSFCKLTGYSEEELIDNRIINLLIPAELKEEFLSKRSSAEWQEFEQYVTRKNESRFLALFRVSPLYDEHNQPIGRTILIHDLTERRRELAAIKESDERLRFLMQSSSEGIVIHENGIITDVNDAVVRTFGYSYEDLIGKPVYLFTSPKEHASVEERIRMKLSFHGVQEIFDKEGKIRHVEVNAKTVTHNGQEIRVLTVKDISELREKKIEEQRLISIIEASPFLVVMMDALGLRYMNPCGRSVLGYDIKEDLTKLTIADLMSDESTRVILEEAMPTASAEGIWTGETTFNRKDGSEFPSSQTVIAHRNQSGEVDFFSSIAADITEHISAAQTLRENEERLRYFMEESLEAIIISQKGNIIDFNSAACKMFSYNAEELRGKEVISLYDTMLHPEIIESVRKNVTVLDEWTGVKKDGTRFDIEVYSRPHTYKGKDVLIISILDISPRKKTERALRSSEVMLNAAVEGTNVGIWDWNLITNQITFNETWKKLGGLSDNESSILFDDWKKTVVDEDLPSLLDDLKNHLYGSMPMFQHVYRVKQPGGRMMVMEAKGKIIRDEHDSPVRIVGTTIDITERQQMEDALREREAQLSTLIENREESIWSVDRNKRLIRFNTTFANIFREFNGIELQQGIQLTDYLPESLAAIWNSWYDEALQGISIREVDRYTYREEETFVEYTLNPIVIEGSEILGVSVVGRDITKQKYYEQSLEEAKNIAEEASRTKSQFLANISHEIRTPMNGIIGFTDLLFHTTLNQKQKEYLDIVRFSADSLLRLINDLLDIAKIESGKMTLVSQRLEPRKLVNEIIRSFKAKAAERKLKLIAKIDKSVPKILYGDEIRLQQVFINLIGNAVKFSEHGKISVRINLIEKTNDHVTLLSEVEDEGIGISKERHETIFEPFSQVGDPLTSKYGGTGLGLSIARRLVEMMDGQLAVESELEKGSKFHFTVTLSLHSTAKDKDELLEKVLSK